MAGGVQQGRQPPSSPAPSSAEETPEFKVAFAIVAGLVILTLAIWVLGAFGVFTRHIGLGDADWNLLEPEQKVASKLMVPLTVSGIGTVALGAWMAVVEWRGLFRKSSTTRSRGAAGDVGAIIGAVGKLRGAALLMVMGTLLMLGAAWVAKDMATPAAPADSGTASGETAESGPS